MDKVAYYEEMILNDVLEKEASYPGVTNKQQTSVLSMLTSKKKPGFKIPQTAPQGGETPKPDYKDVRTLQDAIRDMKSNRLMRNNI